jgi:purine-nucleoside phosphorylase
MTKAVDVLVERLNGLAPKIALVLGSGLGGLVSEVEAATRIPYGDLPGFPKSGVTGHAGEVVAGLFAGTPVLMLAGRAHYYEHGDASVMRPVIEALAGFGIEKLILTNAAGSLDEKMPPGSIMLITDHINFSGSNPLFGEPTDRRFVGLTEAYDADAGRLRAGRQGDGISSCIRASTCGFPVRPSRRRPKSAWRAVSARMRSACRQFRK